MWYINIVVIRVSSRFISGGLASELARLAGLRGVRKAGSEARGDAWPFQQ
jgi:hypothetical protein